MDALGDCREDPHDRWSSAGSEGVVAGENEAVGTGARAREVAACLARRRGAGSADVTTRGSEPPTTMGRPIRRDSRISTRAKKDVDVEDQQVESDLAAYARPRGVPWRERNPVTVSTMAYSSRDIL